MHRDGEHLFAGDEDIPDSYSGLAKQFDESAVLDEYLGTLQYSSPELLENRWCNEKVDMFAFGAILFVI